MRHYLTVFEENGEKYAEAWIQINFFGLCICFSKRRKKLG